MVRRDDPISLLMRDLKGCPRFTKQQETALWRRWQRTLKDKKDPNSGNPELRNQLVLSVVHWALRQADYYYKVLGTDQAELCSEAMDGVMDSFKLWNPRHGRLITYSRWWVLRRLREFIKQRNLIRVPLTLSRSDNCQKAAAIARGSMLPISDVVDRRTTPGVDVALMEEEERTKTQVKVDRVLGVLHCIDGRYAKILRDRAEGRTLKDIGKELGITRERVRQLQIKALRRVRQKYAEMYPDD